MSLWHGFFFLALLVIIPETAHAVISFDVAAGSCSNPEAFTVNCSDDPSKGLFTSVACKTFKIFNGAIVPIYCAFVGSSEFNGALQAILVLYIMFWGISYATGIVQTNTGDTMKRLLKFVFIFYFVSNQDLFFSVLYSGIMSVPDEIVKIIISQSSDADNFYAYVDEGIYEVFHNIFYPEVESESGATSSKPDFKILVLGLVIWKLFPAGNFIAGLFLTVIVGWIGAYLSIMIRYMLALMTLVFLFMLTPIFLTSMMFDRFKFLGEEWIKMILSFIIQIAVVVAFVLMVEDFFIELVDVLKIAYNEVVLEKSYKDNLVSYNTAGDEFVDQLEANYGVHFDNSEKYVTELGYPEGKEFIPWLVIKLVEMVALVYLTVNFMRFVPSLAGYLAGNPKFVNLMKKTGDVVGQGEGRGANLKFQEYLQKQGESVQSKMLGRSTENTVQNQ